MQVVQHFWENAGECQGYRDIGRKGLWNLLRVVNCGWIMHWMRRVVNWSVVSWSVVRSVNRGMVRCVNRGMVRSRLMVCGGRLVVCGSWFVVCRGRSVIGGLRMLRLMVGRGRLVIGGLRLIVGRSRLVIGGLRLMVGRSRCMIGGFGVLRLVVDCWRLVDWMGFMVGWSWLMVGRGRLGMLGLMIHWLRLVVCGFWLVCGLRLMVGGGGLMISGSRLGMFWFMVGRLWLVVNWFVVDWLGLMVDWFGLVVDRLGLVVDGFMIHGAVMRPGSRIMGSWWPVTAETRHAGKTHRAKSVSERVRHGSNEHGVERPRDAPHASGDGPREGVEHRSHATEHATEHSAATATVSSGCAMCAVSAVTAAIRGSEGDAGHKAEGEERRRRPHLVFVVDTGLVIGRLELEVVAGPRFKHVLGD